MVSFYSCYLCSNIDNDFMYELSGEEICIEKFKWLIGLSRTRENNNSKLILNLTNRSAKGVKIDIALDTVPGNIFEDEKYVKRFSNQFYYKNETKSYDVSSCRHAGPIFCKAFDVKVNISLSTS